MNPNAQPTRVESFDRSALALFSNRRIRTRTYGGVGGAEPRGSPLSRSLTRNGHRGNPSSSRCESVRYLSRVGHAARTLGIVGAAVALAIQWDEAFTVVTRFSWPLKASRSSS